MDSSNLYFKQRVRFFDERSEQARVLAPLALPLGDKGDALLAKNPALIEEGKNPFSLDSKEPNWANFHDFLMGEVRYLSVKKAYPNEAEELHSRASSPTRSLSPRPRREEPRD